jgi:hypothetical protein
MRANMGISKQYKNVPGIREIFPDFQYFPDMSYVRLRTVVRSVVRGLILVLMGLFVALRQSLHDGRSWIHTIISKTQGLLRAVLIARTGLDCHPLVVSDSHLVVLVVFRPLLPRHIAADPDHMSRVLRHLVHTGADRRRSVHILHARWKWAAGGGRRPRSDAKDAEQLSQRTDTRTADAPSRQGPVNPGKTIIAPAQIEFGYLKRG